MSTMASSSRAAVDKHGPRLVAVLLLVATVGVVRFRRAIDGDEGFYLMAARLISEGRHLYHDFFFIQAPVLPHVYAMWFALVKPGWHAGRAGAALIAVAGGVVLFEHLRRATAAGWALVGVLLFASTGLVLGWFTTVKTYGLASLF